MLNLNIKYNFQYVEGTEYFIESWDNKEFLLCHADIGPELAFFYARSDLELNNMVE